MPYQIMFYGGLIGILISLPLAIYIYYKFEIAQVLEDLTGINLSLKKGERRLSTSYTETEGNLRQTSNEIQIKRQPELIDEETELLMDKTEAIVLLGDHHEVATTVLDPEETTLLTDLEDENPNFVLEENIIIVHSSETID